MKRLFFGALLLSLIGNTGCSEAEKNLSVEREIEMLDVPAETKIPASLWEKLAGTPEASAPEGESSTGVQFMPVSVILREKSAGVLSDRSLRLRFPRGGGTLDLAPYVTGSQGSFYLSFEWPEVTDLTQLKVWYDSKGRRRNLEDGTWGSGCGRYFEITAGLLKEISQGGLKLNTTRERHLTVAGGHYFFVFEKDKQRSIAKVTIKDSRYPILFCEEL